MRRPNRAMPSRALARHRILLGLLILSWAIGWPVIKLGVATVPPLWYACFRYVIGAVCLFALVVVRHEAAFPPPSDWPLVAVSGILQMAVYSPRRVGLDDAASLAYVGPVATAFAYWAVVEAGRHFQARTLSMALLVTPALGVVISAFTLREAVGASLIAGVFLIAAGIHVATRVSNPSSCPAS